MHAKSQSFATLTQTNEYSREISLIQPNLLEKEDSSFGYVFIFDLRQNAKVCEAILFFVRTAILAVW